MLGIYVGLHGGFVDDTDIIDSNSETRTEVRE